MVLAHELSHLILNHNRAQTDRIAALGTVQLVALALLQPTGIPELLGTMLALSFANDAFLARRDRDDEFEADSTAVQIASRACYDPARGSRIFGKLYSLGVYDDSWVSSHPNPATREQRILAASAALNAWQCGETITVTHRKK